MFMSEASMENKKKSKNAFYEFIYESDQTVQAFQSHSNWRQ